MDPFRNPSTREDLAELEHQQREFLLRWFEEFYFDPIAEEKSGIQRKYRWPSINKVDPFEELSSAFGQRISTAILKEVAKDLSRRSDDWRARPDEFASSKHQIGRPAQMGDHLGTRLWVMPEDLRLDVLQRIAALEATLAVIQFPPPHFGHNNPPEALDELPATQADVGALQETLHVIRDEIQKGRTTPEALTVHKSTLVKWAKKVASWIGARATKFSDEAASSAGKVAGPTIILAIAGILPKIEDLTSAMQNLINYFSNLS